MFRKLTIITFIIVQIHEQTFAQKRILGYAAPSDWPVIDNEMISPDGRYAAYNVGISDTTGSFSVEATDLSWKKEFPKASKRAFTNDSRKMIFEIGKDSLCILELGTDRVRYISKVGSFEMADGPYLAYQKKDREKTLILLNLVTEEQKEMSLINKYVFSKNGKVLLMMQETVKDSSFKDNIVWVDLPTGKVTTICHGCFASDFKFDEDGRRLVFLVREPAATKKEEVSLLYYREDMDTAEVIAGSSSPGMGGMVPTRNKISFNKDGGRVFFTIKKEESLAIGNKANGNVQLSISGTHDIELKDELAPGPFLATVDLEAKDKHVVRLQQTTDKGGSHFQIDDQGNWVATESNVVGDVYDRKWNISVRPDIYLISTRDGSRQLIKRRLIYLHMSFSPTGRYLVWFDRVQKQWFSYDIVLKKTFDISAKINAPVYIENDQPGFEIAKDPVGWLEHDKGFLIYDRHDIWELDPDGDKAPINITGGYGASHHIRFRYLGFSRVSGSKSINEGDTIFLLAFNETTKEFGFYRLMLSSVALERLTMSAHMYIGTNDPGDNFWGSQGIGDAIRSEDGSMYLLRRMSPMEYPNLYVTTDFRDFKPLTNFAPQKGYNWYRTELVRWKLPDGKPGEGILFKPENFDATKKYPIIFYYYEKNAFSLNGFIHPMLSSGPMNIPWYVSNGYLMFVPDISYRIGHPGQSACDAVVSAALYLSKRPWIDASRMGLQGHSFGGFETNYIVSHSTLFAAAVSASGYGDIVGEYGGVDYGTWYWEETQGRIGATIWERPDLYIENSSIFKADKVKTPILIEVGKNDIGVVAYWQGVQWYNLLHRLQKKAWLLMYNQANHTIDNPNDRLDYSIRMAQFFDHYLKGMPAPKWMTMGSLSDMDIKGSLEADTSGRQP